MSWIFDRLTEPLGLPIEWYWEWLILAVIGLVAYKTAFRSVGDLISEGFIGSGWLASIAHWLIRLIVFVAIWAVTYGVIWVIKKLFEHWVIVLCVLGVVLVTCAVVLVIKHKNDKKK